MERPIQVLALGVLMLVLPCPSLAGDLLRVPQVYATIQAAIDTAGSGDTVLVADGRYLECVDFKGKNITLGSLFLTTGDPGHITATVVDAQQQGPTVKFSGGESRGCQMVGFTLTGGQSPSGGGIECRNAGPSLSHLIIQGNVSATGGGGHFGGMIGLPGGGAYFSASSAVLENILIARNFQGGVDIEDSSTITMLHVTIDDGQMGVTVGGGSKLRVWNSIIWDSVGSSLSGAPSDIQISCSDIRGGWPGDGNIDARPAYIDKNSNNYLLSEFSPCLGRGNPTVGVMDDLRGEPRPQPAGSSPDMGAYEHPRSSHLEGPGIILFTMSLEFGEVFLGDSLSTKLFVRNPGTLDLLISGITIDDAAYSVYPPFVAVHPEERDSFEVRFAPATARIHTGSMTFMSNATNDPAAVVQLRGSGVKPPIIAVVPESMDVELQPGHTTTRVLTISNAGESNLRFHVGRGYARSPAGSGNGALQFDGRSGYAEIPNSTSLQPATTFTVEAWGLLESLPAPESDHVPIVWRGNNIGWGNDYHYRIAQGNGTGVITWGSGGRDGVEYWFNGGSVAENQWHHFAYVVDGPNLVGYMDGDTAGSSTANPPYMVGGYKTYMGYANRSGSNVYTDGMIDEVRIWEVARSQDEIQQNMYQELAGTESGLVGYWRFNEGAGDTIFDGTRNRNHGAMHGSAARVQCTAPIAPLWLTTSPDSGSCAPHASATVAITFDATRVDTGNCYGALRFKTNDPLRRSVSVPVHLYISTTVDAADARNAPAVFNLHQNYPNPFNPSTTITYTLPVRSRVSLTVFNVLGEKVGDLVNGEIEAGYHEVQFDGGTLASGVYLYQLRAGDFVQTRKLVLLR